MVFLPRRDLYSRQHRCRAQRKSTVVLHQFSAACISHNINILLAVGTAFYDDALVAGGNGGRLTETIEVMIWKFANCSFGGLIATLLGSKLFNSIDSIDNSWPILPLSLNISQPQVILFQLYSKVVNGGAILRLTLFSKFSEILDVFVISPPLICPIVVRKA
jgi:hypothetical protein